MVQGMIYKNTECFSVLEYFVNICEKFLTLKMCLYWASQLYSCHYCSKAPNSGVKYVAQTASCSSLKVGRFFGNPVDKSTFACGRKGFNLNFSDKFSAKHIKLFNMSDPGYRNEGVYERQCAIYRIVLT